MSLTEQALSSARREGYLKALADVEAAVYSGQDALFALLASVKPGER